MKHLNGPILFQLVTTVISAYVLCAAIVKRSLPRSLYYTFMSLSVFLYNVGYMGELTSATLEVALMTRRLQHAVIPFVGLLYFLFVLQYYMMDFRSRRTVPLLLTYPVLHAICIMTGDLWFPYYENFVSVVYDPEVSPYLSTQIGPLYTLFIVYVCTFILLGFANLVKRIFHQDRDVRHRSPRSHPISTFCFRWGAPCSMSSPARWRLSSCCWGSTCSASA